MIALQKRRKKTAESFCTEAVKYKMFLSSMLWSFFTPPAGLYRFHEDVDNMVQVLEAPLWGGKASLVLLLPFHVENLARLDKLLTPELLSKWLERTAVISVSISLPKANLTSTLSLQVGVVLLATSDDFFNTFQVEWCSLEPLKLCALYFYQALIQVWTNLL